MITAKWIRHSPEPETMRQFHKLGIGKAMGENSIFFGLVQFVEVGEICRRNIVLIVVRKWKKLNKQ